MNENLKLIITPTIFSDHYFLDSYIALNNIFTPGGKSATWGAISLNMDLDCYGGIQEWGAV